VNDVWARAVVGNANESKGAATDSSEPLAEFLNMSRPPGISVLIPLSPKDGAPSP